MAATSSKNLQQQIQEDLLKCAICCDQFVNPHVLTCQHTFCLRCIKGCLKSSSGPRDALKCPVCRKETILGKNGASSLSKNLTIAQLIQAMKKAGVGTKTASSSRKNNNVKKQTAKGSGRGNKKRDDHESEYKRVYRREYTPSYSSDDSSSSSDDYCTCGRGHRCEDYTDSSSSSYSSSSYYSSSEDSPLAPVMKKSSSKQRRGGCGGVRGRGRRGRPKNGGCCRR